MIFKIIFFPFYFMYKMIIFIFQVMIGFLKCTILFLLEIFKHKPRSQMSGIDFEKYCAKLLKQKGYQNVKVTQASGDQGVDILATHKGQKYAIQCKLYSNPLGNSAIQEVYAGKDYYHCQKAMVMTNSDFTSHAKELAKELDVELWSNINVKDSSQSSGAGCLTLIGLFLIIGLLIDVPQSRLPILVLTIGGFVLLYSIGKRKTSSTDSAIPVPDDTVTETMPENISQKIDETLTHLGNIYVNFFKEHYNVNCELIKSQIINDSSNEFIIKAETESQAKYLLTKESEMNQNLEENHTMTLLANNCISLLITK